MVWMIEEIIKKYKEKAEKRFINSTKEELIEHISKLEAALHTMTVPLSSLDIAPGPRCSAYASSKLFPFREDDDKYMVYNKETSQSGEIEIPDEKLHEIEYYTVDSISIKDGSKLHDDFQVIAVHQSAPACYIGCGAIWMKDIRRAAQLLWGKDIKE